MNVESAFSFARTASWHGYVFTEFLIPIHFTYALHVVYHCFAFNNDINWLAEISKYVHSRMNEQVCSNFNLNSCLWSKITPIAIIKIDLWALKLSWTMARLPLINSHCEGRYLQWCFGLKTSYALFLKQTWEI